MKHLNSFDNELDRSIDRNLGRIVKAILISLVIIFLGLGAWELLSTAFVKVYRVING